MSHRKNINHGLQIGTQNNQGASTVNNVARDMIVNNNTSGVSLQEFQSLLSQITSQVHSTNLSTDDKQYIEAVLTQVVRQSQQAEPKKSLIVDPLRNAFTLITEAAGAATSLAGLAQLVQKAIGYAQGLF